MDKLQFTVKVENDDVKTYSLYDARRRTTFKILRLFAILYTICCLIICLLSPRLFWTAGLGALVVGLMVFVWLPSRIRKRSKDNYETAKVFSSPITYTFDDQGVEVKGNSFESKFAWNIIYEVRELKTLFLLYGHKSSASIIPKRNLSDAELVAFRTILSNQKNLKWSVLKK